MGGYRYPHLNNISNKIICPGAAADEVKLGHKFQNRSACKKMARVSADLPGLLAVVLKGLQ